ADSKLSDAFKTGDDNLQGDQGKQEVQFRITRNPEDLLKLIRELKDQTAKVLMDD
ncbi:hypothetical protein chiPu_0029745, partial [Chiloscyllium punctatum]|nr:hypothetical protein [Chiloscyllium punctatum]